MNNLVVFNNVIIKRYDLIFFDGSGDEDLSELGSHLLSNSIEFLTASDFSHVGIADSSNTIIESTTLTGKSGPQLNNLRDRVENYDGVSIYLYRLKDEILNALNKNAVDQYLFERINRDHYSYRTIGEFLLPQFIKNWIPYFNNSHPGEEVCSEYITTALKKGGILKNLNPHNTSPGLLAKQDIYKEKILLWHENMNLLWYENMNVRK